MDLTRAIYHASATFPKGEIYGLRSQLRRAAVSIPSNIAEDHGRLSDNLFKVFLAQARGSLFEVQTQLTLAADFEFISPETARILQLDCEEVARHQRLNERHEISVQATTSKAADSSLT